MTTIKQRLARLDRIDANAATRAIIAALSHALDDERDQLVDALLARPGRMSLEALVAQWDALSEHQRDEVIAKAQSHKATLKRLARSERPGVRRCSVEIIAGMADITAVDLVVENLESAQPTLARTAGWALDTLAASVADRWQKKRDLGIENEENTDFSTFIKSIVTAIESYPAHREIGVLSAAARLLPLQSGALNALFAHRDHPAMMAFRGFLKHLPDNELAPRLIPALLLDETADQSLEQIKRFAHSPRLATALVGRQHVLRLPMVRKRLERLNKRKPPLPPLLTLINMTDPAMQRAMARWVGTVSMLEHERVAHLAAMTVWPDAAPRLTAVRELLTMETQDGAEPGPQGAMRIGDALCQFCFDPDERIARIALRSALERADAPLSETIPRLLDSPHASVRALAASARHEVEFDEIWKRWAQADPSIDDRLLVWSLLRSDRVQLIASLRARLVRDERETVMRAMRLARDARVESAVELELLKLAGSDDGHVSATAIAALGRITTDSSRVAVQLAVRHPDSRTRSNAIEALGFVEVEQCQPALDEVATTDGNRPRATAIHAMCQVDRPLAKERLAAMLHDKRPMHRISALWAADQTGMIECGKDVAHLASADPMTEIRRRAAHTAKRLIARIDFNAQSETESEVMTIEDEVEAAQVETAAETPAPLTITPRTRFLRPASAFIGPFLPLTLARQPTRLQEISEGFMNRSAARGSWWQQFAENDLWFYALGLATVFTIASATAWWKVRDEQRAGPGWRLMARHSALTNAQRRALMRCARAAGWQNPIAMLLSRGAFEYAVARATNTKTKQSWRQQIESARRNLWND